MICRCFGRSFDIAAIGRRFSETADLMVGVPNYEAYVGHVSTRHPEAEVMTRDVFFRERQAARYGAGSGLRCC